MADAKTAIALTLVHEGGYVNNPNDSGGATNHGITQADMPGVDMRTVTEDQATEYYIEHYWKSLYSQIESQLVANKLFDLGVLFGVAVAVRILQLTLNTVQDGIFGVNTLAAVNQSEEGSLLDSYKANMVTHAFNIAVANPKDRIFLKGWGDRINS